MPTIFERKKIDIEEKKKKIRLQEQILREKEKRRKIKRAEKIGRLAVKAGIDDIDDDAFLGAFIEIAEKSENQKDVERWKKRSTSFTSKTCPDAIILTFETPPSKEEKETIKSLGLKWNKFRNEYYGYGELDALKKEFPDENCTIRVVDG